ncbi:MAG: anion permease [Magnetococcales bacterium]|nr:anion permease [Magnetococcales bacterium]
MELTILIFLSSGLFLGWSLGANDAANVFGTAVGSKMVKFSTAALICSVFVILGAVISGSGAAHTLGKLGAVNAIAGSFMAAFAAAFTVMWMTKLGLPVSTSQAVVGAIIGWNLYTGSITDMNALTKILLTWVACPILGAIFGAGIYKAVSSFMNRGKIHLLRMDSYTRIGLIAAGAFGSYALGANNIANVMGVFVSSSPFVEISIGDVFTLTSIQQLFGLGAVAIAVGVYTYSKRVMLTVGGGILPLTPVGAWSVVVAHSIVLFLFASVGLEHALASAGLPTIPLVPVSSSQAVVGAVIGIGLLKGGKGIQWSVLGRISSGWISTPIISAAISFIFLFFLQNVFQQQVYKPIQFELTSEVMAQAEKKGINLDGLGELSGKIYSDAVAFHSVIKENGKLDYTMQMNLIDLAEISFYTVDSKLFTKMDDGFLDPEQVDAVKTLANTTFDRKWKLAKALANASPAWQFKEKTTVNKLFNKHLKDQLEFVCRLFSIDSPLDDMARDKKHKFMKVATNNS